MSGYHSDSVSRSAVSTSGVELRVLSPIRTRSYKSSTIRHLSCHGREQTQQKCIPRSRRTARTYKHNSTRTTTANSKRSKSKTYHVEPQQQAVSGPGKQQKWPASSAKGRDPNEWNCEVSLNRPEVCNTYECINTSSVITTYHKDFLWPTYGVSGRAYGYTWWWLIVMLFGSCCSHNSHLVNLSYPPPHTKLFFLPVDI